MDIVHSPSCLFVVSSFFRVSFLHSVCIRHPNTMLTMRTGFNVHAHIFPSDATHIVNHYSADTSHQIGRLLSSCWRNAYLIQSVASPLLSASRERPHCWHCTQYVKHYMTNIVHFLYCVVTDKLVQHACIEPKHGSL